MQEISISDLSSPVNLDASDRDWVEPDVSVICDKSKLTDRGCSGAPGLVIEVVSPSSRKTDYYIKRGLYAQAGVREYWAVDPARRIRSKNKRGSPAPRRRRHALSDLSFRLTSLVNENLFFQRNFIWRFYQRFIRDRNIIIIHI